MRRETYQYKEPIHQQSERNKKKKKRCTSSKRSQQKIKKLAKIAEVRNEYETQLYNAKDNFENDETWSIIMSPDEKEDLKNLLNESYEWVYSKVAVETPEEIVERRMALDSIVAPIQERASEYKTYPKSVQTLKDLINEVNDTIINKWPLNRIKAPKEQKKSVISLMNDDVEWLEEIELEIENNHLMPWDEKPASTKDVELRIRKLTDLFDKLKDSVRRIDGEL